MTAGAKHMTTFTKAAIVAVAWLACVAPIDAAEFEELDTDRDAFTPATTTAKVGTVLTEASYVWIDNRGAPATNSFPELLVRIGVRERFEWRLGFNHEHLTYRHAGRDFRLTDVYGEVMHGIVA